MGGGGDGGGGEGSGLKGGGGGIEGGEGGAVGGGKHTGVTSAQLSGHACTRRLICSGVVIGGMPWRQLNPRHASHRHAGTAGSE